MWAPPPHYYRAAASHPGNIAQNWLLLWYFHVSLCQLGHSASQGLAGIQGTIFISELKISRISVLHQTS